MTVVKVLLKYKLNLVGVQEIEWDTDGTKPASECTFFCGKGNENYELGRDISYIRESYEQLRW
jgi:hypothetical protein